MKWKITWWFLDAVQGISRGTDIVEADEEFDEDDAETLLDDEMWGPIYGWEKKTKNFRNNSFSPEPMKWGILRLIPLSLNSGKKQT